MIPAAWTTAIVLRYIRGGMPIYMQDKYSDI